jgi:hypothetical protein
MSDLAMMEQQSPRQYHLCSRSGYFASVWNDGLNVQITAKDGTAVVGMVNLTLNTTVRVFETFNFGPLTELDFSSSGGVRNPSLFGGAGTQFAVDDLTINFVPESTSLGMALLGLITLLVYYASIRLARHRLRGARAGTWPQLWRRFEIGEARIRVYAEYLRETAGAFEVGSRGEGVAE